MLYAVCFALDQFIYTQLIELLYLDDLQLPIQVVSRLPIAYATQFLNIAQSFTYVHAYHGKVTKFTKLIESTMIICAHPSKCWYNFQWA